MLGELHFEKTWIHLRICWEHLGGLRKHGLIHTTYMYAYMYVYCIFCIHLNMLDMFGAIQTIQERFNVKSEQVPGRSRKDRESPEPFITSEKTIVRTMIKLQALLNTSVHPCGGWARIFLCPIMEIDDNLSLCPGKQNARMEKRHLGNRGFYFLVQFFLVDTVEVKQTSYKFFGQ